MKKISMEMPKEEMFTIIQTCKKVNKKHRLKSIEQAIIIAREEIPDNETEHMCFVLLNEYDLHIGTHLYHSTSSNKCVLDLTKVMRKIMGVPGVSSVVIVHNHPFTSELKPSTNDVRWASHMATVFQLIGLNVLDFIIINHTNHYSFLESKKGIFKTAYNRVKKLLNL